MEGLDGKTVIVTGGGGGIGRAICLRLAKEGCIVGVFDIRGDEAEETVRQVGDADGGAVCQVGDGEGYLEHPMEGSCRQVHSY